MRSEGQIELYIWIEHTGAYPKVEIHVDIESCGLLATKPLNQARSKNPHKSKESATIEKCRHKNINQAYVIYTYDFVMIGTYLSQMIAVLLAGEHILKMVYRRELQMIVPRQTLKSFTRFYFRSKR